MHTKLLYATTERTFAIVFDEGEEVVSGLESFAEEQGLMAAHLTAIGAFREVELAFFDMDTKQYQKIPINEQVEVLSLLGNVARSQGEPKLHLHVVVGKRDGTAHGGHLAKAFVRPTLEVVLIETPDYLRRRTDPKTGLPLLDIDEEEEGAEPIV